MGHCGDLVMVWLCAMGHGGKFDYALWATAQNGCILKICTMGHSRGFGYALWYIAQDLVVRYGL